jgi:hypothetical protein
MRRLTGRAARLIGRHYLRDQLAVLRFQISPI